MKVEVLKENLKNNLLITERVAGKNLSLPILNNVLINTEDAFLNLTSTDLEIIIKSWILVKIIKKGKAVVPARFLSAFISSLPDDKIIMETKGQNLYIECRNFKTQIQGYNPEEFPIIPQFNNGDFLEIEAKKLQLSLNQVVDIVALSQNRPEISGIYFNFSKNQIKLAATDSFRLAEKNIILPENMKNEYSFILPQKSAKELINISDNQEGMVGIFFSPNQVMFEFVMKETKHPQIQIISRLIEGEYPNYQEIIPTKFKTKILLKKEEFLTQIKTASLFSGKVNEIKISANTEKQEVEIFAINPNIGENKSTLPAKIEGESITLSFNYKYLIDGLLNIKSSEATFEISREEGPCILRPIGDSSYQYMVMPIKAL